LRSGSASTLAKISGTNGMCSSLASSAYIGESGSLPTGKGGLQGYWGCLEWDIFDSAAKRVFRRVGQ
jgi:hypothetical protein